MTQYHTPGLPSEKRKTYSIDKPIASHTREARCEEVDCAAQAGGWETLVNESTDLGARQAHYIRTVAARHFTETLAAGVTTFRFPPGEQCFAGHRVSLDRPEIYLVRPGDFRSYGTAHIHTGADPWLNDFGTHQDSINTVING